MYKVIEVAEKLGVSKVTIYKKVNSLKQEIKPYIYKKKGITYIDDTGIEMIKNSLDVNQCVSKVKSEVKTEEIYNSCKQEKSMDVNRLTGEIDGLQNDYINALKEQIDYLKNELDIKNNQLTVKDHQLNNKDELIRNFQILLKEDKDRILLLEERLEEKEIPKDQQTMITAEIMKHVKEENKKLMDYISVTREEEKKKSFWSKLFGK